MKIEPTTERTPVLVEESNPWPRNSLRVFFTIPPPSAEFAERFWSAERMAEYDRVFNPPSVYDWIDPWEGR